MNRVVQSNPVSILKALAYYDVFNFPLNLEELFLYSDYSVKDSFLTALHTLIKERIVFQLGDFYSIQSKPQIASNRIEGDNRAKDYQYQAYKKSKLIAKFPYVKGVLISGSLSKGTMGEDGDIDYFIISTPNRLWVARTLLILYKKIFLLNSRKYFCINYLVDENSLSIEHQNRFTATELITLVPMTNPAIYNELISSNSWVKSYYKSIAPKNLKPIDIKRSGFQKLVEPILNTKIGDALDDFFMKVTLNRWKNKFGNMSQKDFNIALQTSKNVSKHHPSNFQKTVIKGFDDRMIILEKKLTQTYSDLKLKEA